MSPPTNTGKGEEMSEEDFKKFPSIDKFSDVWINMQRNAIRSMKFRAKIKLHGTNAAVRVHGKTVAFQKRTQDITVENDNFGFARWASSIQWPTDVFDNYTIYGEWAGPGINSGDAVCKLDRKCFFVFAVLFNDRMFTWPSAIKSILGGLNHPDIFVLPWYGDELTITDDVTTAQAASDWLVAEVDKIGEVDPYIKDTFGVEGVGEGLVVVPYSEEAFSRNNYSRYTFKVKTEAHSVNKVKNKASVKPEVPSEVKDFVTMFVTDNRCEQMVREHLGGSYAMKGMGTFLKELNADIIKESKNELGDLEWKQVAKEISNQAVKWFKAKNEVIL